MYCWSEFDWWMALTVRQRLNGLDQTNCLWSEVGVVLFSVAGGGVFGAYGLYVVNDVLIG